MTKGEWIEVGTTTISRETYKEVLCVAEIRCNRTGEIQEYETTELLGESEPHPSVFNWEDNNFSCDCNRRIFFDRAKGCETDDSWDNECSDGKFSVNLKNKRNNEYYYREFEEDK